MARPKPPPEPEIPKSDPLYKSIDVSAYVEPGEDIDDDAVLWRAYKRLKKHKRTKNLINWEDGRKKELEAVLDDGSKVVRHSEFHYSFHILGVRVDFWPSTNKWRMNKKLYYGNFNSLCGFIKKRMNPTPKGTYPDAQKNQDPQKD